MSDDFSGAFSHDALLVAHYKSCFIWSFSQEGKLTLHFTLPCNKLSSSLQEWKYYINKHLINQLNAVQLTSRFSDIASAVSHYHSCLPSSQFASIFLLPSEHSVTCALWIHLENVWNNVSRPHIWCWTRSGRPVLIT